MSSSPDHRKSWTIKNKCGLNICLYKEKLPEKSFSDATDRVVLLCHGLQSHYELEFCCSLESKPKDSNLLEVQLNTANCWAQTILRTLPNCSVYGMDHQGHGSSDCWGSRTNVEYFDNYPADVIAVMEEIGKLEGTAKPICLVGISLGGAIVTRTLQILGKMHLKPQFKLGAAVLLAPAVSIELLKKKPINMIAMPFAPLVSCYCPNFKCGDVEGHPKYPMIDQYKDLDKKAGQGRIPSRLSNEMIKICDLAMEDAPDFLKGYEDTSVHFIHSKADGFVDPEGSIKLHSLITCPKKKISMLEEDSGMWHYLTMELGTQQHVLSKVMADIKEM